MPENHEVETIPPQRMIDAGILYFHFLDPGILYFHFLDPTHFAQLTYAIQTIICLVDTRVHFGDKSQKYRKSWT